jgi:hypothetical protein
LTARGESASEQGEAEEADGEAGANSGEKWSGRRGGESVDGADGNTVG